MLRRLILASLLLSLAVAAFAQRRGWGWRRSNTDGATTARELESHSTGTPIWENPPAFDKDVFTFARIRYDSRGYGRDVDRWDTDLPDSDLNFSFRLQQMTSMKVDPNGRILRLTDPELADYPFIYMVEAGDLIFSDEEVAALRAYLLNGGFLLFDDFWGDSAWDNVESEMARVFPERKFFEIPLDHELYQRPFLIKSKGQVPALNYGVDSEYTGITWERGHGGDTRTVHHRAIADDQGRLMVIATHNTDNGDGWEREGESDYYFHNFSEKIAYPLGINIIFYIMTH